MAALNDEVKQFIVQALACFDTPSGVSAVVKQEFGLDVPRQQVQRYDPDTNAGQNLGERWKVVFYDARERFRGELAEIPIANRAFRLRALGRMALWAESRGNIALAAEILEQAAREVGEMYVRSQPGLDRVADEGNSVSVTIGYALTN